MTVESIDIEPIDLATGAGGMRAAVRLAMAAGIAAGRDPGVTLSVLVSAVIIAAGAHGVTLETLHAALDEADGDIRKDMRQTVPGLRERGLRERGLRP